MIQREAIPMKSKTMFLTRAALLAAVMCILAPITIPIGPVPITLGVFAVMLAGTILNWKEAGAALLVYLLLGIIGLPVFSSGKSGPAVLVGPTGGYLWTFLFMAIIIALFSSKERGSRVKETVFAVIGCLVALVVCYFFGTLQFMHVASYDLKSALAVCVYPFVAVDIAKAVVASVLGIQIRSRLRTAGIGK